MGLPHTSAARRPVVRSVVAAAALAGSVLAVPAAHGLVTDVAVPVLWEGTVETSGGALAVADVVAYARPPAGEIVAGVPLTPIARTTTTEAGHFVLRAAPSALAHVADPGGWASVMVVASSEQGMALAVDSVSWKPASPAIPSGLFSGEGRWITSPEAMLAGVTDKLFKTTESRSLLARERPAVLTLETAGPTASPTSAKRAPSGPPPKGEPHCVPTAVNEEIGVRPVAVGELHREHRWGGEFAYTSTKSSSFQVGSSVDGKHWRLAGSMSMSKNSSARADGYEEPTEHLVFETTYADMIFTKFTWACGEPYWHKAYTIEPTDWTGGMRDWPGVNPTKCNPAKTIPVPPNDNFHRTVGTSQTLQKAISVKGFVGSVTTAFTATVDRMESTGVAEMWKNAFPRERRLCGDRTFPRFDDTRVISLP